METRNAVQRVIERVGDLPAMPATVAELLRLTDDPMVELSEVTQALERDPALTAKILRVSNSPYYGMKQYVGTLKLALVILGVREVRNIVLGIAVVDTLHDEKLVTLVAKNFWSHAFMVAGFAKKLANTLQIGTQGEAFTSGLLHDIGKLILLRQLGSSYADIIKKSGGSSDLLYIAEREKYGFSHADAAAALAVAWNFPAALGDALLLHHAVDGNSLSNAKDPKLAAIIRISNLAAHEDFEAPQGDSQPFLNEEAWQILKSVPAPIAWDSRYDVMKSIAEELKEVPIPNF